MCNPPGNVDLRDRSKKKMSEGASRRGPDEGRDEKYGSRPETSGPVWALEQSINSAEDEEVSHKS